ncbi:MAG TPA: hypothetical protein QGG47_01840, partial [Acidobacteriota bacterium]|nr:hypothetical protein [Acidobacteriota bacterium]
MTNVNRSLQHAVGLAAALLVVAAMALDASSQEGGSADAGWNPRDVARYLDARMEIWLDAGTPLRTGDAATSCVSCHTTLPYAMSRPILRHAMGANAPTPLERRLLQQVIERVETYADHELLYEFNEAKKVESRGTEAVLNALILTAADGGVSDHATHLAFARLWETQRPDGAWDWLQFGLEPFESVEAVYHGAVLAALAVGAGGSDATSMKPAASAGVEKLIGYLRATFTERTLFNRTWVLLASTRLEGLLTEAEQEDLLEELRRHQRHDGGWSLWSFGGWRWGGAEEPFESPGELDEALLAESDGYATGLVVHALREAGVAVSHPVVDRGLKWLLANQRAVAVDDESPLAWRAHSLNFDREH